MTNPFFPELGGPVSRPTTGVYDDVLSDIAPFTRRNTTTMLKKFEDFVAWVQGTVKAVDENDAKLRLAWIAQAEYLITEWDKLSDDLKEAVINNSVELQDPVLAALFADQGSESYEAVNALLHDIVKPDPDDEGTFVINLMPSVNPDGLQEDPNDEGFFI